jgi:hypothetical protein
MFEEMRNAPVLSEKKSPSVSKGRRAAAKVVCVVL